MHTSYGKPPGNTVEVSWSTRRGREELAANPPRLCLPPKRPDSSGEKRSTAVGYVSATPFPALLLRSLQ